MKNTVMTRNLVENIMKNLNFSEKKLINSKIKKKITGPSLLFRDPSQSSATYLNKKITIKVKAYM